MWGRRSNDKPWPFVAETNICICVFQNSFDEVLIYLSYLSSFIKIKDGLVILKLFCIKHKYYEHFDSPLPSVSR